MKNNIKTDGKYIYLIDDEKIIAHLPLGDNGVISDLPSLPNLDINLLPFHFKSNNGNFLEGQYFY